MCISAILDVCVFRWAFKVSAREGGRCRLIGIGGVNDPVFGSSVGRSTVVWWGGYHPLA